MKAAGKIPGYTPYWVANLVVVRGSRLAIEQLASRSDLAIIEHVAFDVAAKKGNAAVIGRPSSFQAVVDYRDAKGAARSLAIKARYAEGHSGGALQLPESAVAVIRRSGGFGPPSAPCVFFLAGLGCGGLGVGKDVPTVIGAVRPHAKGVDIHEQLVLGKYTPPAAGGH
mgnify:CR=1 FL=1